MDWKTHISSEPSILFGKAVIKNTRIPVELILEKLGHGYSFESLKQAYPRLTNDDILACLLFAAHLEMMQGKFSVINDKRLRIKE